MEEIGAGTTADAGALTSTGGGEAIREGATTGGGVATGGDAIGADACEVFLDFPWE